MSNSDRTTVQIAKEASGSFGTPPTSGFEPVRFTSESLGRETATTNSATIRSDRNVEDVVRSTVEGSCELSQEMDLSGHIQFQLLAASINGTLVENFGTYAESALASAVSSSDNWVWHSYNASPASNTPVQGISQDSDDTHPFGGVQAKSWWRHHPKNASPATKGVNAGGFLRCRTATATPLYRVAQNQQVVPATTAKARFDLDQKKFEITIAGNAFTLRYNQPLGVTAATCQVFVDKLRIIISGSGPEDVGTHDFAFSSYTSLATLLDAVEAALEHIVMTLSNGTSQVTTTSNVRTSWLPTQAQTTILNTNNVVPYSHYQAWDTDASTDYDTIGELVASVSNVTSMSMVAIAADSVDPDTTASTAWVDIGITGTADNTAGQGVVFYQNTRTVEFEGADILSPKLFDVKYTGDSAASAATVQVTALNSMSFVVTGGSDAGTDTIDLTAGSYDTIAELYAYINATAGIPFTATGIDTNHNAAASSTIDTMGVTSALGVNLAIRTSTFKAIDADILDSWRYVIEPGTGANDASFTMQKSFLDVDSGEGEQGTGMTVDSVTWSVSPENMLTQTYSFKGENVSHLSGLTTSGQVATSTRDILNAVDNIGGVYYSTPLDDDNASPPTERTHTMLRPLEGVMGLELTVSNGLRPRTELGYQGPQSFGRAPLTVTGTLSVYYDDYSSDIIERLYEGFEDVELCFAMHEIDAIKRFQDADSLGTKLIGGFTASKNHGLVIELPRVKFTGGTRHATGTGTDIIAELNFQAFYDSDDDRTMRYVIFAPTGFAS